MWFELEDLKQIVTDVCGKFYVVCFGEQYGWYCVHVYVGIFERNVEHSGFERTTTFCVSLRDIYIYTGLQ